VAAVAVVVLLSLGTAVAPGPLGSFSEQNPIGIGGGGVGVVLGDLFGLALPIGALVAVLAVASLVIRYRRAAGVERAQLKWFAAVATISVPALIVGTATYGMDGVAGIRAGVTQLAECLLPKQVVGGLGP
jgi:hypothetical protein